MPCDYGVLPPSLTSPIGTPRFAPVRIAPGADDTPMTTDHRVVVAVAEDSQEALRVVLWTGTLAVLLVVAVTAAVLGLA